MKLRRSTLRWRYEGYEVDAGSVGEEGHVEVGGLVKAREVHGGEGVEYGGCVDFQFFPCCGPLLCC